MNTNDNSTELNEKVYMGPIVLKVALIEVALVVIIMLLAGFGIYALPFGIWAAFFITIGAFVGGLLGKLAVGTRQTITMSAVAVSILSLGLGYAWIFT